MYYIYGSCRHLHVRLLLLRPVLSSFVTSDYCDGGPSTSLSSMLSRRIFLQCAVVCVKVAQEAIDTVHKRQSAYVGDMGNLSAWWYNVLFLYTSATVLIAARLSPSILAEIPEAAILDSWRKAIEVLEGYGVFGPSIRRLVTTLRLLFDTVPQQYSRQRQQPRANEADMSLAVDQAQACDAGTSESWCQGGSMGGLQAPVHVHAKQSTQDNANISASEAFWDFEAVFDPNDVSWLTTVPFDS